MNINTILRRGSIAVVATLAGTLAVAQADAQPRNDLTVFAPATPEDLIVATVSYADLNLARSEGQAVLEQRVRGAVRRVCPVRSRDLSIAAFGDRCIVAAWEGARPQMAAAIAQAGSGYAMRDTISVAARP